MTTHSSSSGGYCASSAGSTGGRTSTQSCLASSSRIARTHAAAPELFSAVRRCSGSIWRRALRARGAGACRVTGSLAIACGGPRGMTGEALRSHTVSRLGSTGRAMGRARGLQPLGQSLWSPCTPSSSAVALHTAAGHAAARVVRQVRPALAELPEASRVPQTARRRRWHGWQHVARQVALVEAPDIQAPDTHAHESRRRVARRLAAASSSITDTDSTRFSRCVRSRHFCVCH